MGSSIATGRVRALGPRPGAAHPSAPQPAHPSSSPQPSPFFPPSLLLNLPYPPTTNNPPPLLPIPIPLPLTPLTQSLTHSIQIAATPTHPQLSEVLFPEPQNPASHKLRLHSSRGLTRAPTRLQHKVASQIVYGALPKPRCSQSELEK